MAKQFLTADDLSKLTGNSMAWSRKTIQSLNNDLKNHGFLVIRGKVPKTVFDRAFGIEKEVRTW